MRGPRAVRLPAVPTASIRLPLRRTSTARPSVRRAPLRTRAGAGSVVAVSALSGALSSGRRGRLSGIALLGGVHGRGERPSLGWGPADHDRVRDAWHGGFREEPI